MPYTKLALRRDASVPPGQPAPMHLDCPCGLSVPVTSEANACACGAVYDSNGWVITASPTSQTEQAARYASRFSAPQSHTLSGRMAVQSERKETSGKKSFGGKNSVHWRVNLGICSIKHQW